jgi:hypothetical protein
LQERSAGGKFNFECPAAACTSESPAAAVTCWRL